VVVDKKRKLRPLSPKTLMANKDKPARWQIGQLSIPFKIKSRLPFGLNSEEDDVENAVADRPTMRPAQKRNAIGSLRHNKGYIFLFCVFVAFMQAGSYAGRRHQKSTKYPTFSDSEKNWLPEASTILPFSKDGRAKSSIGEHPIPKLMDEAEAKFRKKLGGQSKTLKAAVAEYRKRYKRRPPKGFGEWWKFAQKYNVKMVDEYDGLMEDLTPFWELSGRELRRRAVQVSNFSHFYVNTSQHVTRLESYRPLT
jgi:hypothetical protein